MSRLLVFTATALFCGLLAVSCSPTPSAPSAPAPDSLDKVIATVATAFEKQDAATLNSLIDKEMGLTVVFRRGTFDELQTISAINFAQPVPEHVPFPVPAKVAAVQFQALPTYDCEAMTWSKSGLFCDTTQRNTLLTTTVANRAEFGLDTLPPATVKAYADREARTRRVIFASTDGKTLIFHLTQSQGRWFLTLIDRVTDDCSA